MQKIFKRMVAEIIGFIVILAVDEYERMTH